MWVIVPEIVRVRPLKPPIPLASIPLLVLTLDQEEESCTSSTADPQHSQTDSIPSGILGRLGLEEHIRRHDPSQVTKTDLHGGANGALIMPRYQIRHPYEYNGLRDIAARNDQEQCKVFDSSRQIVLGQQHDVTY